MINICEMYALDKIANPPLEKNVYLNKNICIVDL